MQTPDNYQIEIYRKMPPEEKWRISMQLYYSAWDLKEAAIKKDHPDWSARRIRGKVREIFLYAGS
jgi:hypothetical protein